MAKALGVGGVFFKSPDPKKLMDWYSKWLGIEMDEWGTRFLPAGMPKNGATVWAPFAADTDYFGPGSQTFMFNLVVDDLDGALAQVKEGGAQLAGDVQKYDYGSFGWFIDPDGNKVELWQTPE
jgi:predicted enzyme related to lactoylglutathione lyase